MTSLTLFARYKPDPFISLPASATSSRGLSKVCGQLSLSLESIGCWLPTLFWGVEAQAILKNQVCIIQKEEMIE